MRYQKTTLSLAIALSLSLSAGAEEYTSEETLTVTGSRLEQSINDVSGTVTVIDAAEVETIQATDIGDLLDYTPGVNVETDSRYGIRSINIRGLEGNYVKIKVDNVNAPAEFESGQSFIASSRIDLDIDMIRSVEITRGPASASQGSDAIGGLVMFTTKNASDFLGNEDGFGGHVKFLYDDSTDGFRQSYALAHREGNLDTVLSYSQASFGAVEDYFMNFKESVDPKSVLVKTTYFLNNEDYIRFSLDYNETDSFADIEDETDGQFEYTNDTSKRLRYGLQYQGTFNNAFVDTVLAQVDWQEKDQSAQTYRWAGPSYYNPTAEPIGELKDYGYTEEGYAIDLQLNKTLGNHQIAYGATYISTEYTNVNITYDDTDFDGNYDDNTELFYYIPSADAKSLGIFFIDQISLLDGDLLLSPSIRYDSFELDPFDTDPNAGDIAFTGYSSTNVYESFDDSEVTVKLGAVYKIEEDTRVFAQFAQGFRAPDFNQLYYSFANDRGGYKYQPNTELKSEFSDSYEFGVRHNNDFVSVEASLFYSDFKDFIDTASDFSDPSYPFGIYYRDNIAEATIKGFEVTSTFETGQLIEGSWATLAISNSQGEDGDGNALASVTPWTAAFSFNYDSSDDFWGLSLRVKHYSAASTNDFDETAQFIPDAESIIDLTAYVRPMDGLTLRAGIYNLTDEKWYRWSTIRDVAPAGGLDTYAEAKRSFTLTAKYEF
ncbi:TonB-dependent hemoglobin/transferrin/lactoferrin family receptor [Alteromonas sp. KUL49]|uniref:TonB-dependent hemoglobin/transferrin/lactoferrin family receptor n=1 Tax=Alteromonas sp. KUL49 TaxID=2480798 RepID=UPI00102ED716|nr:TonB-dependent hemoglobin/transferrin/lactoferrin family receptor [Alteromonas sp. KUL49]TAP40117.1 TonB-dependent hemoglobin/transferrin/lactoferrin family receptor [Alteromonas sp. KUL49]